jgi:hypothetical protein
MSAFPAALKIDALAALRAIPNASVEQRLSFSVQVDHERLEIPYRIYSSEPSSASLVSLSPRQLVMFRCLYSRHHDGFARERNLAYVIDRSDPWVVPFVVALVGEYILEILLAIERGLRELDTAGSAQRASFGRFVAENPVFFELTSQRVTSYWNEYYRFQFPRQTDYPGSALIAKLRSAGDEYKADHNTPAGTG